MKSLFIVFVLSILLPVASNAQKSFDIHGIHPGMITREVILQAHAPIDTMIWGGEEGASILAFKGEYLSDTGEFRVGTEGVNVSQVSFVSKQRKPESNDKAVQRMIVAITKLYGPPSQDYTNVYHIIQWDWAGLQLTLSTMEHGQFYSLALTKVQPLSTPGSGAVVRPKLK